MDALRFDHISFTYGSRHFSLSDISFALPERSFTAVLGVNGSGKTTLLRLASGILVPSHGAITVLGDDALQMERRALARRLAFVPQHPPPAMGTTVTEYVLLGRVPYARGLGFTSPHDLESVHTAMEITDCLAYADAFLAELSGGELQRAMVARALAQEPRVLLLDEPNSHLDIAHQLALFHALQEWQRRTGGTVVASTHDLNLASMFSSHVVVLNAGTIAAAGTPADVLSPAMIERVFSVHADVQPAAYGAAPAVHVLPD